MDVISVKCSICGDTGTIGVIDRDWYDVQANTHVSNRYLEERDLLCPVCYQALDRWVRRRLTPDAEKTQAAYESLTARYELQL